MDDTDDKIRRNLVVSSAIVLLTVWLDLPVANLLERLLSSKADLILHIEPWRVWLAGVALLSYFGLRYRFSDATADLGDRLSGIRREYVKAGATHLFYRRIGRYMKNGAPHRLLTLDDQPLSLRGHAEAAEASATSSVQLFPHHRWHDVHATIETAGRAVTVTARLRAMDRIQVVLRSWVRLAFYSKHAVELLLPIALWLLALAVAVFSLTRSLLAN